MKSETFGLHGEPTTSAICDEALPPIRALRAELRQMQREMENAELLPVGVQRVVDAEQRAVSLKLAGDTYRRRRRRQLRKKGAA